MMWTLIKEAYGSAARIALALPLLFLLVFAVELIQHVIEYRVGMFDSIEAARAAGENSARLGFGQVKILSLVLLGYWVARWLAPVRPVAGDGRSARLFAWVVLFGLAMSLFQYFGLPHLAPLFPDRMGPSLTIGWLLVGMVLEIYLAGWKVGAALGNERLGIASSFRIIHGNFWWSLVFSIVTTLPLLIIHYLLNLAAIGRPVLLIWVALTFDAAVVAYLGLLLTTATFLIARRAAERSDTSLT